MKVVLRADVDGVGKKGDVVEVSDGHGRNLLIPKGLAFKATPGAERQAETMRRTRELRDAESRSAAEEIATRLVGSPVTIAAKAGDGGRLFGSVTHADIVRAVEEQYRVVIDRRDLLGDDHLKELGTHNVMAKIHADVQFPISVEIIAD